MSNKAFWFWMVVNTVFVVLAVFGYVGWASVAVYFAIGDYGQMISSYIEKNFGEN